MEQSFMQAFFSFLEKTLLLIYGVLACDARYIFIFFSPRSFPLSCLLALPRKIVRTAVEHHVEYKMQGGPL